MSPRRPVENQYTEDAMDEESWEDWQELNISFGEKLEWAVGTRFIGVFEGTREVQIGTKGGGFDTALSAQFMKNGQRYWTWPPTQLKSAIEDGVIKAGQTVMIECTGEGEPDPSKPGYSGMKEFTVRVKPGS